MKKILCFIITVTLIVSSTSIAFAKQGYGHGHGHGHGQNEQHDMGNYNGDIKGDKKCFKIDEENVIKYGKYTIPINPITEGLGATADFKLNTGVLTVTKDTTTIIINFKDKTVTVNGVTDTTSRIFTVENKKKAIELLKYIAEKFGIKVTCGKDKITIETSGLNAPTGIVVTPVGTTFVANTLNTTTFYMVATANIIAAQATGGKAELYVGSKLVATDTVISATDTIVAFSTSDATPTNAELQLAIPQSGEVTVKLYNASNQCVTGKLTGTLTVDYSAPTIIGVTSALYSVSSSTITLIVTGAGAVNDKVDVTKISLYNTTLSKTYVLTNANVTGSKATINGQTVITIKLGSADVLGLTGFSSSTVVLSVGTGPFISDTAGNTSTSFTAVQTIPVTITN